MPLGSQFYIELYKENYFLKLLPLLNHLRKFDQTQQEWSLVTYQNCWNGSDWLLERCSNYALTIKWVPASVAYLIYIE